MLLGTRFGVWHSNTAAAGSKVQSNSRILYFQGLDEGNNGMDLIVPGDVFFRRRIWQRRSACRRGGFWMGDQPQLHQAVSGSGDRPFWGGGEERGDRWEGNQAFFKVRTGEGEPGCGRSRRTPAGGRSRRHGRRSGCWRGTVGPGSRGRSGPGRGPTPAPIPPR